MHSSAFLRAALTGAALFLLAPLACHLRSDVDAIPSFGKQSELPGTRPPNPQVLRQLSAVFTSDALPFAGDLVGHGTRDTFSLFTSRDSSYVVMSAGCAPDGSSFVAEGYFRRATLGSGGLVRLRASGDSADWLCGNSPTPVFEALQFEGRYGGGNKLPEHSFTLKRKRPLAAVKQFDAVAHHGACRTIDSCGVSENSIESILRTPAFGASIVEVDTRLTRDGIPVLFHDETLSPRLVEGELCHGRIADFDLAVLRTNCTLKYGEQIPTLAEAMEAVYQSPDLIAMWVDVKEPAALIPSVNTMRASIERFPSPARQGAFVVGLADDDIRRKFLSIPKDKRVPCLLELEPEDVKKTGCMAWAPRWTRGALRRETDALRDVGISTVFWTVNETPFIDAILRESDPAAMLSDRVGTVLYRHQRMLGAIEDNP